MSTGLVANGHTQAMLKPPAGALSSSRSGSLSSHETSVKLSSASPLSHTAAPPHAATSFPLSHSSGSLIPPAHSSGPLGLPSLSDDDDFEDDIYPDPYGVENERDEEEEERRGAAGAAGEEEEEMDEQRRHMLRLQKIHERQSGRGGGGVGGGRGGEGRGGREEGREKGLAGRPRSLSELSLLETQKHVLNWQDFMVWRGKSLSLSFSPPLLLLFSHRTTSGTSRCLFPPHPLSGTTMRVCSHAASAASNSLGWSGSTTAVRAAASSARSARAFG